jgi:hypothetical protein
MNRVILAFLILGTPAACLAVTAPDLSPRIRIDGNVSDYTPDEWVLDATSDFAESPFDSRWGADNDIHRIAVTWDTTFLYIAVEGEFQTSELMAFLEHAARGIPDLISAGPLRRNVDFTGIEPNLILKADPASPTAAAAVVSISEPLRYLDGDDDYQSSLSQPSRGAGALEVALPWTRVLPGAGFVKLLAMVTGGEGTGSGDAAPDPRTLLEINPNARAHLDNSILVPVDADHDGTPDMGVLPRLVAAFEFAQSAPVRDDRDISMRLETKSFAPDASQVLRFQIQADCGSDQGTVELYVTCEVYSVSGERVRVLFVDEPRTYQAGVAPQWDEWDGRDDRGGIVRGGVYIVNAVSGASPGATTGSAKQSAAVIR